jgi:hypothetical protein
MCVNGGTEIMGPLHNSSIMISMGPLKLIRLS